MLECAGGRDWCRAGSFYIGQLLGRHRTCIGGSHVLTSGTGQELVCNSVQGPHIGGPVGVQQPPLEREHPAQHLQTTLCWQPHASESSTRCTGCTWCMPRFGTSLSRMLVHASHSVLAHRCQDGSIRKASAQQLHASRPAFLSMAAVCYLPQLPPLDEWPERQAANAQRGDSQLHERVHALTPPAQAQLLPQAACAMSCWHVS